ncbi:flavin reductase [Olsenella sp. YH-ols2217]|uniref:Flavin reductase n=1 Tax=Kribbibacterium absianum TaxID=3044210 RepID=A0ABT6ZMH2_9ACTN|nr:MULTISPECIES: flavin reductase [unclassified Olsenella]MDJ1122346.1 flavin reductase [Olsenella sp. YH-ols2216]MDJ1130240.1 flavin reductase [Olsenella sp. YH-ols2217]
MDFVEIQPQDLQFNPFEMIGTDWMLVTAGNDSAWNTMTASWGQMGTLWNKPVATIYLRPQRYTKEFVDQTDDFTLSFFGEEWHEALETCGSLSGRDADKALATGLAPMEVPGSMAFEQAELIVVCHKLYAQQLEEQDFVVPELVAQNYPNKDFHTMYVGRIDHMYIAAALLEDDEDECGCGHEHHHHDGDCGCGHEHHEHHHHDGECCCHHHE